MKIEKKEVHDINWMELKMIQKKEEIKAKRRYKQDEKEEEKTVRAINENEERKRRNEKEGTRSLQ